MSGIMIGHLANSKAPMYTQRKANLYYIHKRQSSEPGFTRKYFLVCTVFFFFFVLILNLRKVTHVWKFAAQDFLFQERKCGQQETSIT